ncbi:MULTISPECIES: DUF4112 domain-containing protein [unclassified Anaeromyxobacter]|uniref:DUF4112 domain-containing protein n=1 Tax=unclassified Anaeromyxobacter TaxID=2620896 RepID=UPI001F5A48F3|nr:MULTISPECIES: DUF4112 domain-containing protein [unclassified Anaeromyxobacter]
MLDGADFEIGGAGRAPDPRLREARLVARWLDAAFRIPGTDLRIGLDPIIGLFPGVGDVATSVAAAYVLLVAWRLGAPAVLVARMGMNLAVDAVVGAVPLLGDLFDAGFKANLRNVRLLETWLAAPAPTRRASGLVVAGVLAAALAVTAAVAFAAFRVAAWAYGELRAG